MSPASTYRSMLFDGILFGICAILIWSLLRLTFAESNRSSEEGVDRIGQIEHRTSDVLRRTDGTLVWNDIERGEPVYERDAVYAGQGSLAVIAFDDGARIEVDQNSLIVVERARGTKASLPTISIDVRRGGASGKAGEGEITIQAGGSQLKVEKGAEAKVLLSEDRTVKINVSKGRARIETKTGSVAVKAGERSTVDADGTNAGPVQQLSISLLAPAPAARRFIVNPKEDVVFKWKPHEGVAPYLFELSRNAAFTNLIAKVQTTDPSVVQKNLEPGIYYWRVSRPLQSGDAFSEDRRLALVLDAPPILFQPRDAGLVDLSSNKTMLFSWSQVPDVAEYQFELFLETSIDKPFLKATVGSPAYRLDEGLEEGRYCFRVRSREAERPNAPWSEAACFHVITRPLFRAPKGFKPKREVVPIVNDPPETSWLWRLFGSVAHAADFKASALIIRWEKIPDAPGYLIEIAEDRTFKKIVIKKKVKNNYYRWHTVVRRPHYWRVRVVDETGREGEVSDPIRIDPEVSRPVLKGPPPNKRFPYHDGSPRITLKWKGTEVLKQFLVEIARDASFADKIVSENVNQTTKYVFKEADVGDFYWRVTGIDLLGTSTKPSDSRSFTVFAAAPALSEPPAEQVFVWKADGLTIPLRWSSRPVASYDIQIAEDSEFGKIVARHMSQRPVYDLEPPTMGTLYWRVRGASPKTPWSAPQGVKVVPATPVPMIPTDGNRENFEGDRVAVELRWSAVPRITIYDVEIVKEGDDREAPPKTHRVETPAAFIELEAGRYTWNVRAVHPSGASSKKSDSLAFELTKTEPEAPKPTPVVVQPKPEPAIQVRAVVEPEKPAALYLAPLVGFRYYFYAVFAPRFGVEIAYLLPVLERHLRVALSASYLTSNTTRSSEQGGQDFESRLHGFPIELVAVYIFKTRIVALSIGAGLSLNLQYYKVEIASQPSIQQTDVELGGVVVADAAWTLGPGSLFGQVSYLLTSRSDSGVVENAPGGLGFILGYRFGIW